MAGVKGKSGRKSRLEEAARCLSNEVVAALERVRDLSMDHDAPYSVRLEADKILIEQALGRPSQRTEVTGAQGGPVKVVEICVGVQPPDAIADQPSQPMLQAQSVKDVCV